MTVPIVPALIPYYFNVCAKIVMHCLFDGLGNSSEWRVEKKEKIVEPELR